MLSPSSKASLILGSAPCSGCCRSDMEGHPEQTCSIQTLKLPLSASRKVRPASRYVYQHQQLASTTRLLVCAQGTFVTCASPAPVTATLATATVELLHSDHVHKHTQPYVRRAALVATGQVGPACSCSAAVLVLYRPCAQSLCSPGTRKCCARPSTPSARLEAGPQCCWAAAHP